MATTEHAPGQDTVCQECGSIRRWVEAKFPRLSNWEPCRLHVAAPDLLEAAQKTLHAYHHGSPEDMEEAVELQTKAVAKAERGS